MAKNDNLKDFLTDVADAIREKKGTAELINPQSFSDEIRAFEIGGGTELEGEYYLAKPNGRYWKLNSRHWNSLNKEQQSCVRELYIALAYLGSVYTCIGDKVHIGGIVPQNGIYYTTYGKIQSNLGYSEARMEFDSERGDLLSCFTWQEAYPHLPSFVSDYLPDVTITSLFDYVKLMFELDSGYTPSDEEVYAMLAQMYMIESITKEEYEDMVNRAENEDY